MAVTGSPQGTGYTGMEGQHPHVMVSPCPQGCDVQTQEASSLHHKREGVKWFAKGCAESLCQSLRSKAGSWPSARSPCFAALKQIPIPPEDWTAALLRDQRAKLSLCWTHQLKQSVWCLRGWSLLSHTLVPPQLVGGYGEEASLDAYSI